MIKPLVQNAPKPEAFNFNWWNTTSFVTPFIRNFLYFVKNDFNKCMRMYTAKPVNQDT